MRLQRRLYSLHRIICVHAVTGFIQLLPLMGCQFMEMCGSVDSSEAIQRSPTAACWRPKQDLISDASAGMLLRTAVQLYWQRGIGEIQAVEKKNKELKGGTSGVAQLHSDAGGGPAAPLTAILVPMTGCVTLWHRCTRAAGQNNCRTSAKWWQFDNGALSSVNYDE